MKKCLHAAFLALLGKIWGKSWFSKRNSAKKDWIIPIFFSLRLSNHHFLWRTALWCHYDQRQLRGVLLHRQLRHPFQSCHPQSSIADQFPVPYARGKMSVYGQRQSFCQSDYCLREKERESKLFDNHWFLASLTAPNLGQHGQKRTALSPIGKASDE